MNRTQTAVWSVTHANNRNWLIAATKSDINLRRRRWMICRSRDIDRTTPDRGILQVIGSHDSRQRTSGSRVHSTKDRQFARLGVGLTASEIKVYSVTIRRNHIHAAIKLPSARHRAEIHTYRHESAGSASRTATSIRSTWMPLIPPMGPLQKLDGRRCGGSRVCQSQWCCAESLTAPNESRQ